jgi:hypothetical protein
VPPLTNPVYFGLTPVKRLGGSAHYPLGGISEMDHAVAVERKMTERYLLGELDPQACQEFEEHFFDCGDCALDVRAAALFIEHSKSLLGKESEPVATISPVARPVPPKPGWLAWLRPALATPVMALLLVVIGYQNLVTYPRLQQALDRPQVLPSALVNIGAMGPGEQTISVAPEHSFLLLVRIPPDSYPRHTAELYNPAGKLEWSLTVPSPSTQEQWPLEVPGAKRESGTYSLVVRGLTDNGDGKEVGRATFELQNQK